MKTLALLFLTALAAQAQWTINFPALTPAQSNAILHIVTRENAAQTNIVWTVSSYYETRVLQPIMNINAATLADYVRQHIEAERSNPDKAAILKEIEPETLPGLTKEQLLKILEIKREPKAAPK